MVKIDTAKTCCCCVQIEMGIKILTVLMFIHFINYTQDFARGTHSWMTFLPQLATWLFYPYALVMFGMWWNQPTDANRDKLPCAMLIVAWGHVVEFILIAVVVIISIMDPVEAAKAILGGARGARSGEAAVGGMMGILMGFLILIVIMILSLCIYFYWYCVVKGYVEEQKQLNMSM